jgi:hypothetical protein
MKKHNNKTLLVSSGRLPTLLAELSKELRPSLIQASILTTF